jgi:predicted O-methyltransferase YrrM
MNLTDFLVTRGLNSFCEGYTQEIPNQVKDLIKLTKDSNIHVMEIGFNAGHSAEVFLQNNPSLTLTSFDLGGFDHIPIAKEYIDITYPNRHTLILGDSTITIPKYINDNPGKIFDVIFIDGGHQYPVSMADLENCKKLANNETIVIMDDTIYTDGWHAPWTIGPTQAWIVHRNYGTITEIDTADYKPGRGMSWGKYTLDEIT